ncbi:MAG TPA: MFS transporter [Casimicrobiaceae bacterium]|nr:MFS transporter [Casimicrobiaceae bacterium]
MSTSTSTAASQPDATAPQEVVAHEPHQFALLRQRRFAPFFWTQFLGAANDNVFKNAFVVFVTFEAALASGAAESSTLVNLIGAVFIAPFLLFSATAGQLADKFEKSTLIRWIKLLEIAIMVIGVFGFWQQNVTLLFCALALLGVHSTLFGPVKYSILPQHLRTEELVGGNGLVESGTFIAILIGTIAGGLVVAVKPNGPLLAGALSVAIAIGGWLVSRAIPFTPPVDAGLRINWNPVSETWRNLGIGRENIVVWRSMLGISWFWFYGAILLAQLPTFTLTVLGGDEHVFTLLLVMFSIGIGVGSLLCERMSGRKVEIGLVPFGSIGLTIFAVDLWLATHHFAPTGVASVMTFMAAPGHWRVLADVSLLGVFGGFYTVPLYALIQARSIPSHRSRIIAANNILNALFMVVSAGVAIGLLKAGLTLPQLFLAVGLMNAVVALYIYALVPEFLMRFLAWLLIHSVYRVRAHGLEHVPEEGPCVLVCNHVSFVDAIVIAACVRRPVRFVMDHRIFRTPFLSWLFRTMRAIPIASAREDAALKERAFGQARAALASGEVVGIFPEGRLTSNGDMQPFRPGVQAIVAGTDVAVVPMALQGLWGSFFARSVDGRTMRSWLGLFPRIGVVVGVPVHASDATPEMLFARVAALRGDSR